MLIIKKKKEGGSGLLRVYGDAVYLSALCLGTKIIGSLMVKYYLKKEIEIQS